MPGHTHTVAVSTATEPTVSSQPAGLSVSSVARAQLAGRFVRGGRGLGLGAPAVHTPPCRASQRPDVRTAACPGWAGRRTAAWGQGRQGAWLAASPCTFLLLAGPAAQLPAPAGLTAEACGVAPPLPCCWEGATGGARAAKGSLAAGQTMLGERCSRPRRRGRLSVQCIWRGAEHLQPLTQLPPP